MMKHMGHFFSVCAAGVLLFGSGFSELRAESAPNVLLICVDDLRPELGSFGASYIHSPNIDQLAARGRAYQRHYVQAPTCGASRYALLTGRYGGSGNDALMRRAGLMRKEPAKVRLSMPEFFGEHGYATVSVGKVSHHPGGFGGSDWDDINVPEMPNAWDRSLMPVGAWQHPRGAMHGLANGEIRRKAGEMAVYQAEAGGDDIYPDGLIVDQALIELAALAADASKPFFLAVGLIRPHLPFGAPKQYLDLYDGVELPAIPHASRPEGRTTWHGSDEFINYNRWGKDPRKDAAFATEVRRHYAACVSYADAQAGRILEKLKATGADKNTIIVLWGDHGWHLGEHAIWGKHSLFEESLRTPLVVSYPGMVKPGTASTAIVETIDIFPTLCELADLPAPDFVHGASLISSLGDPSVSGHAAISYSGKGVTLRTATHRLTKHRDGYCELYDHRTVARETRNISAEHPGLVEELKERLQRRIALRNN
jgi:iduronate 2-sulfatase